MEYKLITYPEFQKYCHFISLRFKDNEALVICNHDDGELDSEGMRLECCKSGCPIWKGMKDV